MKLVLSSLIKGYYTYPNWSTGRVYSLLSIEKENYLLIYYKTKQNRIISRVFPKTLMLTPQLSYALGFIKGEGANALGKSNYSRFTLTNTEPAIMKFTIEQMRKNCLIDELPLGCFHIIHSKGNWKSVSAYWSKELGYSSGYFKKFDDGKNNSENGVCHLYLSDVLLRRVIDIIQEKLIS